MFAWDALTTGLDELDVVRAQLREARGQTRTSRFYALLRASSTLRPLPRVASVIELSGGWCLVSWLEDGVALYRTITALQSALCADGIYILSLVDTSEESPAQSEHPTRPVLNARQRQIMRGLGHGMTNKEMALEFGTTESGIKQHLSRLYRYLNVADRMQASLLARDLDLTAEDEEA